MNHDDLLGTRPYTIAFIGNYLPRQCGIATFTYDLLSALKSESTEMDIWAMAMNDFPEGYPYPPEVRFELDYKNLADYDLAADFLNMNRVDAVCLQHEYGIFGGKYGSHILGLLNKLRMPVVTTLHTVLTEPDPGRKSILEEIGRSSDRLVVMSHKAETALRDIHDIPAEKIVLIPHGIHDVAFVDSNFYKDQFGVEGRKVILSFGLVSPGKGFEYMIDALPQVVKRHPDAVYIILGATHPHILLREGEAYRHSLQLRAKDNGVEEHLIFHNRFVELKELCEFIGAADIYVTPYLGRDQIVSGTLSYALGAGKATISTPYWYAEEMLAEGRGRIVPFKDPNALADQVTDLLINETERHAMRKRAYVYCRDMVWKEVAKRYLALFGEIRKEREHHPRAISRAKTLQVSSLELPQPKLDHLQMLTDNVGILQHAEFTVPDRTHGYCTDDNARALVAVMMAQNTVAEDSILLNLANRYLSFIHYAFNHDNKRFRNFMGYDRTWLEEQGSEDCHSRAIWGLGIAMSLSGQKSFTAAAMNMFKRALPTMTQFSSPRAWAFGLVGIHAYLERFGGDSAVKRDRIFLARKLFEVYKANATDDWPWLEKTVNYANAKIPHALLLSGLGLNEPEMIEAGLRSLEWLVGIQMDPKGHFAPIGNHGWFSHSAMPARYDQQPLEAMNMIDVCIEAYKITGDDKWITESRRCFDWFLGRNDLNTPLYDHSTGGCRDALTADGANENQGSESTLSWLISLFNMYLLPGVETVTENLKDGESKKQS